MGVVMPMVETEAAELSRRLGEFFTGSLLSELVRIGHGIGLLEAAARALERAAPSPASSGARSATCASGSGAW